MWTRAAQIWGYFLSENKDVGSSQYPELKRFHRQDSGTLRTNMNRLICHLSMVVSNGDSIPLQNFTTRSVSETPFNWKSISCI
jgi:hypothetical protein